MNAKSLLREEFDRFLAKVRPLLLAFVYRVCGEEALSEDIVQNALVKAFLLFSEKETLKITRMRMFQLTYEEIAPAIRHKKPWRIEDHHLVDPLLTPAEFWNSIQSELAESENNEPSISQKDSFQIGLLSVLQRLPLSERVVFIATEILGMSIAEVAYVTGLLEEDVRLAVKESQIFMEDNYFCRDAEETLWRDEEDRNGDVEKFLHVLNKGGQKNFIKAIDPQFHCLLVPAPMLSQELFVEGFLTLMRSCKSIELDINGQKTIVFSDENEVQALAVVYFSSQGPATVLGYDLECLTPKIRNMTLEAVSH